MRRHRPYYVTYGTNNMGVYAPDLAGNGLSKSGNTFSIDTTITADLSSSQTFTNKTLTNPLMTGNAGAPSTPSAGIATFYGIGTSKLKPGWINEEGNSERIISTTGPASASITANATTTSGTQGLITGLSATITVPNGRTVKISGSGSYLYNSAGNYSEVGVWRGTVGSGTQIGWFGSNGTNPRGWCTFTLDTPSAGSYTYNLGFSTTGGTATLEASSTRPAWILAELL